MATDRIELQIVLDDGSVQRGFANIEKQGKQSAGKIESAFSGFALKVVGAVTAIAGAISFKKAISEAIEAEQATQRFAQSLANLGKFSRESVNDFTNFAEKLSDATGIQDDLIVKNAALLVSLGKLSGEGLERATKAAINLQAAFGGSLEGAFEAIAQAANGNTKSLNGYGIRITDLVPQNERLATSLTLIEQKFGGLAEGQAISTFGGLLNKVGNSINNFLESLGGLVIESAAVRETFKIINEAIINLTKSVGKIDKGFLDNLILGFAELALVINKNVGPVVEVFFRTFLFGFDVLKTAVFGFQTVLANLSNFLFSNVVAPIVKIFTLIGTDVLSVFNKDLAAKVKGAVLGFTDSIKSNLAIAGESTSEVFSDSFKGLGNDIGTVFNTDVSGQLDTFIVGYQSRIGQAIATNNSFREDLKNTAISSNESFITIGSGFNAFVDGFKTAQSDFTKTGIKNFQDLGKAAFQALGTGIGQSFAAFGKALAEGKNAFEAFGQAFVGILGGILIQLGTGYILQGIAASANPLTPGIGGPLIAAGAALATFGGVLSALGGGGGSKSAAASGGGGASESGGGINVDPSSPTNDVVSNTPREPDTKIELNIQGDVLDSDQTGLRIVDLLNSAFDKSGVVVTGAV